MPYNYPRFGSSGNNDNTYRTASRSYINVASFGREDQYKFIPNSDETIISITNVTTDLTIDIDTRNCYLGDVIKFYVSLDNLDSYRIIFNLGFSRDLPIQNIDESWYTFTFNGSFFSPEHTYTNIN